MIVARLWADECRECDPIAVINIADAPIELVVPDAELGLNAVYRLRRRVRPDWTRRVEESADYTFHEVG